MTVSTSTDPARIAGMFDAIAERYDFLNHLLSAGLDRRWRRRAIRALQLTGRERVLDVCTGTADLALAAVTAARGAHDVIGLDFSGEMIRRGREKVARRGLTSRVRLARADAMRLPLADASVDAATVAFGIRNVADPVRACQELARVVRPGGRVAVLEFGMPTRAGLRQIYAWYFRRVLPWIGRRLSRHGEAYAYLPASVGAFLSPEAFAARLAEAGFRAPRPVRLTLGVVYLYVAERA